MRFAHRAHVGAGASLAILSAATVFAGCSSTPVVLPSRDLDRPTDMAFACMGVSTNANGTQILGGAPMGNCHPSGVQDIKTGTINPNTALPDPNDASMRLPNTGTQYRTYAFVANSDRGDLSVIDMSFCRPGDTRCWPPGAALIDLDPELVGYAAAPLGVLPEVVAASQDGCRVVSANRGSCDLTFVDPAVLLTPHAVPVAGNRDPGTPDVSTFATTVIPRGDSGPLNLAPGEIQFLPQQTANLPETKKATPGTPTATYCDAKGTFAAPVGTLPATDTASVPWRAVVTFPSCDLIALLDLPTGNVVDSWRVGKMLDSSGTEIGYSFVHAGRDPVCPVADCAGRTAGGGVPSDAGSAADAADEASAVPTEDGGSGDASGDDALAGDDALSDVGTVVSGVAVAPTGKLSVSSLAIHPEGTHVYFGATNANYIGVLDIDHDTLKPGTGSVGMAPGSAVLHNNPSGATRIRLSVDPFAYSKGHDAQSLTLPEYGRFVAGAHDNQPDDPLEFLYVIARDGSVRVLDVAEGRAVIECDTGIDPNDPKAQAVAGDDSIRKACFPYPAPVATDPTLSPPGRLPSAGGPGLRFAGIPQDIAFANYLTEVPAPDSADPNVTEATLSGAFAFVMSITGSVYIVNIDPALRYIKQVRATDQATCDALAVSGIMEKTSYDNGYCAGRFPESPRPLTHSLRDANVVSYSTGLGPQNGPPRLDTPPIQPVTGPQLRPFTTRDSTINALVAPSVMTAGIGERLTVPTTTGPSTYVYFPNRYTVTAQSWTISWEGDLTGVRYTGDLGVRDPVATKTLKHDLKDNGAGFCGLGATDGDVVTLLGCNDDTGCAPGTVCVHGDGVPTSVDGRAISGLCFDQYKVTDLSSDANCGLLLKTFRRYEIVAAANPTLTIQPKRDEVPRPVFTYNGDHAGERVSCVTDADCRPEMDTVHANFKCVKMNSPAPACDPLDQGACGPPQPTRRCLQPCGAGLPLCRQGRVCIDGFPEMESSFCAEGAPIDPSCFNKQLASYKVSAGNTFVVSGSAVGRVETVVETANMMGPRCAIPLSTPPQSIARIRMNTALCDPAVDLTDPAQPGQLKDTVIVANSPKANPCFMIQACPTDTMPGGVCTVGAPTSPCTLINGDDTSQTCTCPAGNPAATPSKWICGSAVPHLSAFFENHEFRFVLGGLEQPIADVFQIRFDVHGGLGPQLVLPSVDSNPGLPARILLGPIPQPEQLTPGVIFQPALSDGARGPWISDLPYLFVVDQRQFTNSRLGARGQILRITPRVSDTVPLSAFEAFAAGGQYFPIQ